MFHVEKILLSTIEELGIQEGLKFAILFVNFIELITNL